MAVMRAILVRRNDKATQPSVHRRGPRHCSDQRPRANLDRGADSVVNTSDPDFTLTRGPQTIGALENPPTLLAGRGLERPTGPQPAIEPLGTFLHHAEPMDR